VNNNIYASGEYIRNNPTLDVEDVPWKLSKIIPLANAFADQCCSTKVKILDVGGGAGLLLKGISDFLGTKKMHVEKYALDLSREMLEMQKKNNADIVLLIENSIENTSFRDKEFDLVLMVDVLEHVPDVASALRELRRIAKYVIYKVPIENNLYYNGLNLLKRGGLRRDILQKVGHVNFFSCRTIEKQMRSTGVIVACNFTNVFEFLLSAGYHRGTTMKEKVVFTTAKYIFRLSPRLCSFLFPDSIACLVQCS
jgi:SAM-dependent methyltransferase